MNDTTHEAPSRPPGLPTRPAAPAEAPQRIDVYTLLGSNREVILTLYGSEYRLRLTSKGKLILTK